MATTPTIDGWAVLELMGHRRMAGKLTEVLVGGTTLLRIDVPRVDGSLVTQLYGVGSVYCITPTTEEIALAVALANPPEPIHPWELRPRLPAAPATTAVEAEFEAHRFRGHGDGHDDPTCMTCGAGPRDPIHLDSDVHPFVADDDEDDGPCVECGELPNHPLHAHAFVRLAGSTEEVCVTCEAGPDDQVHVVDGHPYEPESESGDPCGHCGRSGHDPIHMKLDPTKDHHVFEEGQREHPELCLHCGCPAEDQLHADVGGGA